MVNEKEKGETACWLCGRIGKIRENGDGRKKNAPRFLPCFRAFAASAGHFLNKKMFVYFTTGLRGCRCCYTAAHGKEATDLQWMMLL